MAGAGMGTGVHTGLRYRGLTKNLGFQKGLGTLEDAALGTKSRKSLGDAVEGIKNNIAKNDAAAKAAKVQQVAADDAAFKFTGSPADMKKQYRKLSREHHPDHAIREGLSESAANKRFAELKEAYDRAVAGGVKEASFIKTAAFFHELASQQITSDDYYFWYDQLRSLS
jgi:hypothetical protein